MPCIAAMDTLPASYESYFLPLQHATWETGSLEKLSQDER